tara:strand:- start:1477 stop:1989 length:513 start_codon:yes stop_codon:yes gene_type:complete
MATIDLGKVKLVWRGTYSGSFNYVPDDVVYYVDSSIGSSYICVANSTGNAPSSGGSLHASWNYLAKGQNVSSTSLKDGSGNVIVQASASAVTVTAGKHLNPATTNTTDLGTSSLRWRNLYTQDLQLSNESTGGNDVDGTWGNWTLQEGENDIFMINNRNGKKYKINLSEV